MHKYFIENIEKSLTKIVNNFWNKRHELSAVHFFLPLADVSIETCKFSENFRFFLIRNFEIDKRHSR